MSERQEKENQEQVTNQGSRAEPGRHVLPPCCHSGCTVCVLDYPELFLGGEPEVETLAMLEAIEQAQRMMAEAAGDGELPTE